MKWIKPKIGEHDQRFDLTLEVVIRSVLEWDRNFVLSNFTLHFNHIFT